MKGIGTFIESMKRYWQELNDEVEKVQKMKEGYDEQCEHKTHDNLSDALFIKVNRSLDSKRGSYYENLLCKLVSSTHSNTVFYTLDIPKQGYKNQSKRKNSFLIKIPIELDTFIHMIYTGIKEHEVDKKSLSDMNEITKEIYDRAKVLKDSTNRFTKATDFTNYSLDLDLGIFDKETEDIYLYEIKSQGKAGADVIMEHLLKLLMVYASVVYNFDIPFEKIHFSWVLASAKYNNKLIHGDGGYIVMDEFIKRHHIDIDKDVKKMLIETIPCINDDVNHQIVDYVVAMLNSHPETRGLTTAKFAAAYKNFYPQRFI